MSTDVTVVGNGVSGYACAHRLSQHGIPVTMVGPGVPCDRPPMTKRALALGRLPRLADHDQLRARGIATIDGIATSYDPTTRRLTVRPATGRDIVRQCDGELVWATGVTISRPPVPGIEFAECNATPAGFERVAPRLAGAGRRRIVIIGGGLIGCETAATLAARHAVTILEREPVPLARMHPVVTAAALEGLAAAGVCVIANCAVDAIVRRGDRLHVATDHGVLPTDTVLVATGVSRALPAGTCGEGVGVETDATLRVVGADHTWACGDVAVFPHPRFGRLAIPHWDHAVASGRHVADGIAVCPAPYRRDPYWFSDIGRIRIQVVGCEEAAVEWRELDRLVLGLDTDGRPACVILVNDPARIRQARELVTNEAHLKEEA